VCVHLAGAWNKNNNESVSVDSLRDVCKKFSSEVLAKNVCFLNVFLFILSHFFEF
jgi:hypothetical protein